MSNGKLHNILIIESMFIASVAMTWGAIAEYWWLSVSALAYQGLVLIAQFREPKEKEPKILGLPKLYGLPQNKGGRRYED